jgi:hypothetical protein
MDQAQNSLILFTVETLGCLISLPLRFSSPSSFLAPSPTTFSVFWVSAHHGFSIVLWGFFLGVVVPQKIQKIKKSIASEEEQQTISVSLQEWWLSTLISFYILASSADFPKYCSHEFFE